MPPATIASSKLLGGIGCMRNFVSAGVSGRQFGRGNGTTRTRRTTFFLAAIQSDVERFVPSDFATEEELRSMLLTAGETAQVAKPKSQRPISVQAIEEERRRFVE